MNGKMKIKMKVKLSMEMKTGCISRKKERKKHT